MLHPLTIGVTGGIASGKTAVAHAFAVHGIPWVDADDVAREVVEPGEQTLDDIVQHFGTGILDDHGHLDRRALRKIVFAAPEERRWLESVTHPRIRERLVVHLKRLRSGGSPYHLLVSPLLFESQQHKLVDRCLVVDVPENLQIVRTTGRDGVDDAQARAIIQAQMPRHERLALADDVIDNQGNREALAIRVAELDGLYRQLASAPIR